MPAEPRTRRRWYESIRCQVISHRIATLNQNRPRNRGKSNLTLDTDYYRNNEVQAYWKTSCYGSCSFWYNGSTDWQGSLSQVIWE